MKAKEQTGPKATTVNPIDLGIFALVLFAILSWTAYLIFR
jgi:hypothetical protein